MNLVIITPEELAQQSLPCHDERVGHILKILKTPVGGQVKMGVVKHSVGLSTIESIDENELTFTYHAKEGMKCNYPIQLIIGATRPLVMKRVLRDCTAIGCREISIYNPENGEKSYLESSLWQNHHYLKALYEGLSISKRVDLPSVTRHFKLQEAVEACSGNTRLVLDSSAALSFKNIGPMTKPITLVIGNERGFTDSERSYLTKQGFISVTMGDHIVRTETACAMALALTINYLP